jgi:hypothetical protein
MGKGDPAAKVECLVDYFNGCRFGMVAIRSLHIDKPDVRADTSRYIRLLKQYSDAVEETIRIHDADLERQ